MSAFRSFFVALVVWACGLLALFLVIDFLVMPAAAGKFRATVEVPAVTGLSPLEAEERLQAQGLVLSLDSTENAYSLLVPRGLLLTQTPAAGARVKTGRRVWAGLSEGREPYTAPDGRP